MSRHFLRFGSTSGLFTSFFCGSLVNIKDAFSYVISVKHRLEPILIEGPSEFTSQVDEVVDVQVI